MMLKATASTLISAIIFLNSLNNRNKENSKQYFELLNKIKINT